MTTSGIYTFSVNRDQIITMAMKLIGKLAEAETPTAQETSDCALLLNMMVKQWKGRSDFAPGLKMWKRSRADLFLSYTSGTYSLGPSGDKWAVSGSNYNRTLSSAAAANATTLTVSSITNATNGDNIGIVLDSGALFWTTISGAPSGTTITLASGITSAASAGNYIFNYPTSAQAQKPEFIEAIVLHDASTGVDVPVDFMTMQDYESLPSKNQSGYQTDPQFAYYEPGLTNGTLYTDVYGAIYTYKYLHIVYQVTIQDFNAATDSPDFPQVWYLALAWGLAQQIAPMFNVPFTDDMKLNASTALAMAREADPETTSLYFQPDADTTWYS